jgi:hypothetical protein
MYKSYFLIFILSAAICQSANAQEGFYLKPLIEKKWNKTRLSGDYNLSFSPNQPINISTQTISKQSGVLPGILLGYSFKRSNIEVGISQDAAGAAYNIYTIEHNQSDSSFSTSMHHRSQSLELIKIPLRYSLRVLKKDSIRISSGLVSLELWATFGYDFIFKSKGDQVHPTEIGTASIYEGNGKYLNIADNIYDTGENWSTFKSIGFIFKILNKGSNYFNIGMNYSWGIFPLSRLEAQITSTSNQVFRHNVYSDGSGFYLTFSKEINLPKIRKRYF